MASAIIPLIAAGAGLTGSIVGNKQQGQGIQLSQEALNKAYNAVQGNLANNFNAAAPWLRWGYGQQRGATDNALVNFSNMLNFGLNGANQARASGTNNALAALGQIYSGMQSRVSPYMSSGGNALNALQRYTFGPGRAGGGGNAFGPGGLFSSGGMTGFQPGMVSPTVVNAPSFVGLGSAGGNGSMPQMPNATAAPPVNAQGMGGIDGDYGISAAEKAAGGFGANPVSKLSSLSTLGLWDPALGQNKRAASAGVNAVSDYVWKDLYPQYKAGAMNKDDFVRSANAALSEWAGSLPENVRRNSIEDQLWWFNNGGNDKPETFQFSIPGFSAVRHA